MATRTIDRSRDLSQPLDRLGPDETLKANSDHLRGTIAHDLLDRITGGVTFESNKLMKFHGIYQQDDRDIRDERRRQKLEPALHLHGPRAPARRRLHARAMAEDRRACAGARRQHAAAHDAPDLPVPLGAEGRHPPDHPGPARGAARHDRRLRRRCPRRHGDRRSGGFRRACRGRRAGQAGQRPRHPEDARLSRDLVRQGARRDAPKRKSRSTAATYMPRKFKIGFAVPPSTTSTSTPRISASSPLSARTASKGSTSRSAAAWAARTMSRPPIRASPTSSASFRRNGCLRGADAVMSVQRDYGDRDGARARAVQIYDRRQGSRLHQGRDRAAHGRRRSSPRARSSSPPTATASAGARPIAGSSTSPSSSRTAACPTCPAGRS